MGAGDRGREVGSTDPYMRRPAVPIDEMTSRERPLHNDDSCNLCGDRGGQVRDGRLGRYQVTCEECEARRGSHLVKTVHGYANRAVAGRRPVAA